MKNRAEVQTISLRKRLSVHTKPGMHSPLACGVDDSIIAIGNVKGGVGKTTLAVNLTIREALCGRDVLLIDGDEQGTARAFTQLRAEQLGAPGYTAICLHDAEIRTRSILVVNRAAERASWIALLLAVGSLVVWLINRLKVGQGGVAQQLSELAPKSV